MSQGTLARWLGKTNQMVRLQCSRLWTWEARFKGVELAERVSFWGRPIIGVARDSRIQLGSGVAIASALRANPIACFQPSVLRTLAAGAEIILDRNVGMSATVLLAGRSIRIGEGTILGSGAMVLDNDVHVPEGDFGWRDEYQKTARPIVIGRGGFIGARAIILKGVTIGDRAVVGAGAVVTKDVPPGCVAAGNPAKILHPKNPESPVRPD
jgi:acetyltransferase-like isoleucine patch superfamily enzyme